MDTSCLREGRNPRIIDQIAAIIKYELLWNIRKKKFLGVLVAAFVATTLTLFLPVILSHINNVALESKPDYVITNSGLGNFMIFLFALVTIMNSISGEFESGTIITLLTKPVSRTVILVGKIIAAFITISAAYALLYIYMVVGGIAIYGPQENLHLIPLCILGDILSTFVWASLILALGSLSKNTILTAVTSIIIFLAMLIGASIIAVFTESAWILHYLPGSGAIGYLKAESSATYTGSISTGTDNISKMIIQYVLHPSANVTYIKISRVQGGSAGIFKELYAEPLSLVLSRSLIVALMYIITLTLISWYAFKHSQVLE
jgi:ABC-type transport system involved in multi-copper enzyme maturation permease subunit